MKLYVVVAGSHSDKGRTYKKGEVVASQLDLCQLFEGKFKPLSEPNEPSKLVTSLEASPAGSESIESKETDGTQKALKSRGKNVTSLFPSLPEEPGMLVFKRGGQYNVYLTDSITPLNEDPLRKDEVLQFVNDFLEN